jgi:hypothetical protein
MHLGERLCGALDLAERALCALSGDGPPSPLEAVADKVVAETAMLLLCASRVRDADQRLGHAVDRVASLLVGLARREAVLAAICLDPGQARDHSFAHCVLSALGLEDPGVDALLAASLDMGAMVGPERLPHRRLEQEWLARVWNGGTPVPACDPGLPGLSMVGRPLDALASTRLDIYAFTHDLMYITDLGARRCELPRPVRAIIADAEIGLAYSLEHDDFDLTAELLMTWPMLGVGWSPAAAVAFAVLAGVDDELGFLPGLAFDRASHDALPEGDRPRYCLYTSYHTGYVMGFLCATALSANGGPATLAQGWASSGAGLKGAGPAMLEQLDQITPTPAAVAGSVTAAESPLAPRWRATLATLAPAALDGLAPTLLAAALRRAASTGDLSAIRRLLQVAVDFDVLSGEAPRQAAALLRRSRLLSSVLAKSVD